jgi:flagellar protein FlbT
MENIEFRKKPTNAIGVMQAEQADSPCKRIYFVVQLMYFSDEPQKLHALFFKLVQDVQKAAPTTNLFIAWIGGHILNDDYLSALDETCRLIEYEQRIIAEARPFFPSLERPLELQ